MITRSTFCLPAVLQNDLCYRKTGVKRSPEKKKRREREKPWVLRMIDGYIPSALQFLWHRAKLISLQSHLITSTIRNSVARCKPKESGGTQDWKDRIFLKKKKKKDLCICWWHWVLIALRLSLVVLSGVYSSLWWASFWLQWLLLLRSTSSRALELQ